MWLIGRMGHLNNFYPNKAEHIVRRGWKAAGFLEDKIAELSKYEAFGMLSFIICPIDRAEIEKNQL